jgi:hypothetical protein
MKSPMDMAPNKMKTPMKMAPNKMKSPMKGNAFTGAKAKAEASGADSFSVDGKEFPIKMKSPMKMGSAYKLDKSGFKMKSAPVNMRTPGSVAKMAGVSPAKHVQWTGEKHKERPAHPNSAEAHGKQPKGTGTKPFTDGIDGAASRPENQ